MFRTLPLESATAGKGSVLTLIENCHKRGIDVYCTPCKNKNEHYKSSAELIKAGCLYFGFSGIYRKLCEFEFLAINKAKFFTSTNCF